jgi:CubicO group peptidase (beta-lactamase class C family)
MKAFGIAALLLVLAHPAFAQDTGRMEQVIQAAVQNHTFMGAALVARGDEIVLNKAYGQANLEWDLPNSPTTKFRLGSLTKQFTAASILLLEERGKLAISDPVSKHLPDAPPAWSGITLHHLLTHTSGIPNFTSLPEYRSLQPFAATVDKTIASFRDKPLDFAPGAKMSYSNSGYLVLGSIIEHISGVGYGAFLQENIFDPLGMKDSGIDSNATVIARRASGYTRGPAGFVNAGFIHMSIPHAAGAVYSTTEDLLRWERGLFGGKVVSDASLKKMSTAFKDDYALGVIVATQNGRTRIVHGGGIEGFNTSLSYYPESRVTVVVLSNVNGPAADELGRALGLLAHGDSVTLTSERKQITVAPATLAAYVGEYEMPSGTRLTITREEGRIFAQLTGQARNEIYAQSETLFFLKVVDAQIEFVKDGKDAVTHLILHQGGRDVRATRR